MWTVILSTIETEALRKYHSLKLKSVSLYV